MKKLIWLFISLILVFSAVGCHRRPIEWQNRGGEFLRFNDIIYHVINQPTPMLVNEHELTLYDTVKRINRETIFNGDSDGLEPGTPVYTLDDYAPSFRLAVKQEQEIVIYQAEQNRHATKAGELMDIGGRVERIIIRHPDKYVEIAAISDEEEIDRLIDIFLNATYSYEVLMNPGTKVVYMVFQLHDGTEIWDFLWLDSGIYGSNIQLPEEFCIAISDAIVRR